MALDYFIKLYEDELKARTGIDIAEKDPYNPNVYDSVISRTQELTGQNPTINAETGQVIELSPNATRRLLDSWYATAKNRTRNYVNANGNLETIIDGLDEKKLKGLVLAVKPHKIEGYEEVAKLHESYIKMAGIARIYKDSEKKDEKRAALSEIYAQIPELIKGRLKEDSKKKGDKDKLSDDDIKIWANVLTRIAFTNPGYALGLYEEEADKKLKEIEEKLDTKDKLKDYIVKNIKKSEDEEKERFYDIMYRLGKK